MNTLTENDIHYLKGLVLLHDSDKTEVIQLLLKTIHEDSLLLTNVPFPYVDGANKFLKSLDTPQALSISTKMDSFIKSNYTQLTLKNSRVTLKKSC